MKLFSESSIRKIISYAIIFFLCILSFPTLATYSWKQKATLPGMARHESSAFAIGTKGYFATGYNPASTYKDLWEWDLATNIWTQKADLPAVSRYGSFAFAINGKGYLGTGWTYTGTQLKDFYEYDPVSNSWTQKADFGGVARYDAVGLSNGSKGYVGFGYIPNHNDWWEYDPVTDTWTARANFPGAARQSLTGFTIGSDIYVGTGSTSGGTLFKDLWKYTPSSNSWTQMTDFPGVVRYATLAFVINGEGYIGSGGNGLGTYYSDFYKYNPVSNSWTPIASWPATPRYAGDGFSLSVNGYAGLGRGAGNIYYADFWEYSPDGPITSFNTAQQNLCPGTCTSFNNLTANATSYQWYFPGASPDTSTAENPTNICYANPGSYDVTLITSNAMGTDTLTIPNYITLFPSPPPQSITQVGDTLFAISGSSSYQWYQNGSIINGATDYYYVASSGGYFNVVTTDTNGCEVEAVVYDVMASTHDILGKGNLESNVYPNPFSSSTKFTLTTKKEIGNIKVEIYNLSGDLVKVLFNGKMHPGEKRILELQAGGMMHGVYTYRISSGADILNGRLVLVK